MAFSIRNQEVERQARAFAARKGTTLTGALKLALDTAEAQERGDKEAAFLALRREIREIQKAYADAPDSGKTEQDIMGWDENGLPT